MHAGPSEARARLDTRRGAWRRDGSRGGATDVVDPEGAIFDEPILEAFVEDEEDQADASTRDGESGDEGSYWDEDNRDAPGVPPVATAAAMYLREISRVPLLRAADEVRLAQNVERGRAAQEIFRASQIPISLQTRVGDENESDLGEYIADQTAISTADLVSNGMLREHIEDVLDRLAHGERRALQLRFGLEDGRRRTLEEVGHELAVTRERARQIESEALKKVRHPRLSRELQGYLD